MAQPNALNPSFSEVGLPGGVKIKAGTAYGDTAIKAAWGIPGTDMALGSIYISTDTSTPSIWFGMTTTWTKLTIN